MRLKRFRAIVIALGVALHVSAQTPIIKTYGIDFSPYIDGQDPNLGTQVPSGQILSRIQIIAPYTNWVRSFSSTHGNEYTPSAARQLGLKIAANAWISSDTTQNAAEIDNLIAAANAGLIDVAIVGSEAILRNDVTEAQLIAYMNEVRQAIPTNIPVTTADVWGTFIAHPNLIANSDVVFANFYPFWEGTSINNALCSLESEYRQLVSAAGSKQVIVSETGWPSAGDAVGAAVPSAANANLFADQFLSWANANNIASFYFEAFDETWKTEDEGPQGAHWGIWDKNGVVKPGEDAFFNGTTAAVTCNGTIPGPVAINFLYVPPLPTPMTAGVYDELEVQVTGVQSGTYMVATYIEVNGGWWTKPKFDQPTVGINPDGTVRIPIETGGTDYNASDIAVFLIPSTCSPPQASGGGLPTVPCAVASNQAHRTLSSISGFVTDSLSNPIFGTTISSTVLGTTTSAPDGKYSFYNITASGNATLSASYPNYLFQGSPVTTAITAANQMINFIGTETVDLSIEASVSPNPVPAGTAMSESIVASNAGPAAATDAVVSASLPASFTQISVSTTRGSCTTQSSSDYCERFTAQCLKLSGNLVQHVAAHRILLPVRIEEADRCNRIRCYLFP